MLLAYYFLFLTPKIENLENSESIKNAQRAKNIFQNLIQDIDNLTSNWTNRSDILARASQTQANQPFNLTKTELQSEDVHLMYLVNENLNVLEKSTIDPKSKKSFTLTNFLQKLRNENIAFFNPKSTQDSISGIFVSERGPMIIAAHRLKNAEEISWLIVGRFITQAMLDRSSFSLRTHLKVWPMGTALMPEKMQTMLSLIKANPNEIHHETTSSTLNAYTYMEDIAGQHPFLILSSAPRNIALTVKNSIKMFGMVVLIANFILVLLILKTLNHAIILPSRKLYSFIENASMHVDAPPRLKASSQDEFGALSTALNELIMAFCSHKNSVMSQAYRSGSSRAKMEVVDSLNEPIQSIVQLVENLDRRLWTLSLHELEKTLAEVKCSTPEDFDLKDFQRKLSRNNEYVRYEIEAHRHQVRKIKEKILRAATHLKSYSHQVEHSKAFSKLGREHQKPRKMPDKTWSD